MHRCAHTCGNMHMHICASMWRLQVDRYHPRFFLYLIYWEGFSQLNQNPSMWLFLLVCSRNHPAHCYLSLHSFGYWCTQSGLQATMVSALTSEISLCLPINMKPLDHNILESIVDIYYYFQNQFLDSYILFWQFFIYLFSWNNFLNYQFWWGFLNDFYWISITVISPVEPKNLKTPLYFLPRSWVPVHCISFASGQNWEKYECLGENRSKKLWLRGNNNRTKCPKN